MPENIAALEKEAYHLLGDKKYQEASDTFYKAAVAYRESDQHKPASICFASAASSLAIESGERSFFQAASIYKKAAYEAKLSNDMEYAGTLFKHAAVCFERDLEYLGFSECFYQSKECQRRHLFLKIFKHKKLQKIKSIKSIIPFRGLVKPFIAWSALTVSSFIWGHGEKPQRTVLFGLFFILFCALIYTRGYLANAGRIFQPEFFESLYFSVITYTTVGYGDNIPLGINKAVAMIESFGGLFTVPIFITGLCRKYLR